jgi:hypothetical protein
MVNQKHTDLGIPNRFSLTPSRFRRQPRLPNLRQVHLIAAELFGDLGASGYDIQPGELGENVTTTGLDLTRLPLGAVIRLGQSAAVELTGLRTNQIGRRVMTLTNKPSLRKAA